MSRGSKRVLTPTEQLVMLRGLTTGLGALHEAQALQLRYWPFAVDPSLEKAEAHVGPEETPPLVRYVWTGSTMDVDRFYCRRVTELVRCIKFMLGQQWVVEIQRNGVNLEIELPDAPKPKRPSPRRKQKHKPRHKLRRRS